MNIEEDEDQANTWRLKSQALGFADDEDADDGEEGDDDEEEDD